MARQELSNPSGLDPDFVDDLRAAVDFKRVWTRANALYQSGFYVAKSSGNFVQLTGFKSKKIALAGTEKVVHITASVTGAATALAVYLDANEAFISYEGAGTDGVTTAYDRYVLTVPATARYLLICNPTSSDDAVVETSDTATQPLKVWRELRYVYTASTYYGAVSGSQLSSASYKSAKLPIDPSGHRYRFSGTVDGSGTALAIYYDASGTKITLEARGVDGAPVTYIQRILNPPSNAAFMAISSPTSAVGSVIEEEGLPNLQLHRQTYPMRLEGKKAVIFGTSIPAGAYYDNYPSKIGTRLGMQMHNEAVGSSMARNGIASLVTGTDPYGWTGRPWQNIAYSLSMTIAEKNELITNWVSKWHDLLVGSDRPATLDSATQAFWRDCSYENRLVARHLVGTNMKDLFMFEHAHNDAYGADDTAKLADMLTTTAAGPGETRNRGYYLSAMSFLIDTILSYNPRARIVLIGHYENARKAYVSQGQLALAELWDFPICRLWEKLGWTQQQVTVSGSTKTITQLWLTDDLHPHTDATGQANDRIAEVVSQWLRDQF